MTQRYIKKSDVLNQTANPEVFLAKKWLEHGNHGSVIPVPVDNPFWESPEGRHGALRFGWIEAADGGHLVTPGDYIVTDARGKLFTYKGDIFVLDFVLHDKA
jgi:hypothetical protein